MRLPLPPVLVVVVGCATCALAPPAAAQSTEKHPELGITFQRPRRYEAVPVQPNEDWVVLYYVEKPQRRSPKAFRPELRFLEIPWVDDPAPVAPTGTDAGPGAGNAGDLEAIEPVLPVNSFERWFEADMEDRWRITSRIEVEERDGYVGFEYSLRQKKGRFHAWACSFRCRDRTVVLLGYVADEDLEEQVDDWRKLARRIEFYEPESVDLSKILRYYEKRDYSAEPYRIEVRKGLVKGWKAEDTENFILVYSTKDQALLRSIRSELEAIREAYVELFPPVGYVDAVSTVRICKDRDEYLKYGGSKGSGGYWNSATEELVFYDYENVKGKMGSGKANTRIVLYHEAFHQYIHYAVGELPPHSWYNEGTGDYFSGARIRGGKVRKIGVNPWRIAYVQQAIERERTLPWTDITRFEQAVFYQDKHRGLCYAQAWSMIYFLRTSKAAREHPIWHQILPRYFEELKRVYAVELGKLADASEPKARYEAGKRAREAAVESAFKDVLWSEIEEAWKEYTLSPEGSLKLALKLGWQAA